MPLYNYTCPNCNETVEVLMKHNDPTPVCEHDGATMEKQFTTAAFKFADGRGTGLGSLMSIPGHVLKA